MTEAEAEEMEVASLLLFMGEMEPNREVEGSSAESEAMEMDPGVRRRWGRPRRLTLAS